MIFLGEYITKKKHYNYPAGSKCKAYRQNYNILVLEMEDGEIIEVLGGYAKGLESPYSLNEIMQKDIIYEEDERFFKALDVIIDAIK